MFNKIKVTNFNKIWLNYIILKANIKTQYPLKSF